LANSSSLSSIPDTLFFNLLHSISQTFNWEFYLGYWAIHFHLNVFQDSIFLLISSFISHIVFFILLICLLNSPWGQLVVYSYPIWVHSLAYMSSLWAHWSFLLLFF
jgi:hypothetical protein